MTPEEQYELARGKIDRIEATMRIVLQLKANNQLIVKSNILSEQVGNSFAANAFNVFQAALFEAEIVDVCALWEWPNSFQDAVQTNSLPSVVKILEVPENLEVAFARLRADRVRRVPRLISNSRSRDEYELVLERTKSQHASWVNAELEKAENRWKETVELTYKIKDSPEHLGLRNYRDKHIAHNLVQTKAELKGKVAPHPKYGHEEVLFDAAVQVFNGLNYIVKDATFMWEIAREQCERCANSLWKQCKLNISE